MAIEPAPGEKIAIAAIAESTGGGEREGGGVCWATTRTELGFESLGPL